jgi:hypothetical protein
MKKRTMFLAACFCVATVQASMAQQPKSANVNPDAKIIADFSARVQEYVKLRNSLAQSAPPMKKDSNPEEIAAAEKTIAAKVIAARATAKPGDIFTPATQSLFRRLLSPVVRGPDGGENKAAIKDDAPAAGEVPYKINAPYPKDAPLSTVPADLLAVLPKLPDDVQYRFAGKNLILYDARPNLIVDFMLNAIP